MRMMGSDGLTAATETAILYGQLHRSRLADHYDIYFRCASRAKTAASRTSASSTSGRSTGARGGISAEDVAKRLMDYGFHAPTLSFPVPGTLMVEPTESESLEELDRFCDAMIAIRGRNRRGRFRRVAARRQRAQGCAAHRAALLATTGRMLTRANRPPTVPGLRRRKFWPPVGRIDNVYGDRNLFCACPPVSSYED